MTAPKSMDPERLARLKHLAELAAKDSCDDWGDPEVWRGLADDHDHDFAVASYLAASRPGTMLALLDDRDRHAAEVESRGALLAEWQLACGRHQRAAFDAQAEVDRLRRLVQLGPPSVRGHAPADVLTHCCEALGVEVDEHAWEGMVEAFVSWLGPCTCGEEPATKRCEACQGQGGSEECGDCEVCRGRGCRAAATPTPAEHVMERWGPLLAKLGEGPGGEP